MITMIVTKTTRLTITLIIIIIIIIIIIKTIKFTNVIGYHKPQFGLYGDNVRVRARLFKTAIKLITD